MSGLFGNLSNNGLEETRDSIGGFSPLNSGIYTGKVKLAYAGQSASGARNITLVVALPDREYRETIYITNRAGENWFLNPNDKTKKVPLPGFTIMDDLCLVTSGKPLAEQDTEKKVVNIYDYDAKKELPKSVDVLTDIIGLEVSLGILRNLENKSEKQGNDYVPTAETREVNTIDKVFHTETKMTVVEARNGQTEPAFWEAWETRNKDQTRDRRTVKDGQAGAVGKPQTAPKSGPPQQNTTATAPRTSLFGKK